MEAFIAEQHTRIAKAPKAPESWTALINHATERADGLLPKHDLVEFVNNWFQGEFHGGNITTDAYICSRYDMRPWDRDDLITIMESYDSIRKAFN